MNRRLLTTFMLAASLGFLAGCQTVDDRIKKNPGVFSQYDAQTQDKIRQGIIELGFTEDMVYLAIGAPDVKRETLSAAGKSTTWIYNTYTEWYDGGYYYRGLYPYASPYPYYGYGAYRMGYYPYYGPAYGPGYASQKEERVRITFKEGKAAVIEQVK
jgi:hypothetical protein